MLDTLLNDIRYSLRTLRKSPAFTAVAVTSIALGIGVNTTIFSLVNAVLLRPKQVAHAEELVDVYTSSEDGFAHSTSSYPDYLDLRATNSVFTDMVGHSMMFGALNRAGRSHLIVGEVVTGNYFSVLGVEAALGRVFLAEEDTPQNARPVAVLGHAFWRREFAGDPAIVGKTIKIRGLDFTVVGVAPAKFAGMVPGLVPDLWIPTMMADEVEPAGIQDQVASPTGKTRVERRGTRWLFLKGRLKPGVTRAEAQANVDVIMARLAQEHPETNKNRKATVLPTSSVRIHPMVDQAVTPGAALLMVVVGLVLLIACANVANMLLARATGRRREIGVRLAIGASRGRLLRQLLTESLVLSAIGAGVGILLASWLTRLIVALQPPIPFTLSLDLGFDVRVLLFTLGLSLVTGVAFGLAPALQTSKPDLVSSLKDGGAPVERLRRIGLRDLLVIGQVAVSVVLLVASMLFIRSLVASQQANLGFNPDGLAVATIDMEMLRYTRDRADQFFHNVVERMRAVPGVQSAALAQRMPLSLNVHNNTIYIPDRQNTPEHPGFVTDSTFVSSGYFDTIGVTLVDGRPITDADRRDSPRVVVVTQAFARKYWPGERAIGKIVRREIAGPPYEIVGVAADHTVRTVGEAPRPLIHFANAQHPAPALSVLVRGRGNADTLAATLKREMLAMEPDLLFLECQSMQMSLAATLFPARVGAILVGAFGVLALLLAAVGLYGVIAYTVTRRIREIGIRMALGAAPGSVLRGMLAHGLSRVGIGLAVGLSAAFVVTRVLSGALYGVGAADPVSYAASAALLLAIAALATFIPARRASRVDPMVALRQQ